jgi:hypothetical protein
MLDFAKFSRLTQLMIFVAFGTLVPIFPIHIYRS